MATNDDCLASVNLFNQFAQRYAEKYFDLDQYDQFYAMFAQELALDATVIDIACGPGNVAACLLRHRPDLSVTGVDLAPKMINIAKQRVPGGQFYVGDCRQLSGVGDGFDGAVFAFGLSYLNQADAAQFFVSLSHILTPGAVLLLTTISANESSARYETSGSGDTIFMVYRTPDEISKLLTSYGFDIKFFELVPSPSNAPFKTQDVVFIAQRRAGGI